MQLYYGDTVCCRTAKAPQGYTLPAFAWYVDQTVGGAVSTGTHGSTMHYGSLSSQVIRHFSERLSTVCDGAHGDAG